MFDKYITPLIATKWGRRSGWAALILLFALLLWMVFSTLTTWYHDILLTKTRDTAANTTITDDSGAISAIPEHHLFGTAGTLPVTSLQLHLVGVIKATPEQYSRVIIAEGDKPGKVYRIGDTLSSGVRVYAITPDGVVLENGGNLEKLPLSRPPLLFQGMPKALLQDENAQEN